MAIKNKVSENPCSGPVAGFCCRLRQCRLGDSLLKGEPGARERYLDLLRAGNSGYPCDLVKRAGVDLASPAPCQAVAARMNRIMDEMEAILAQRKR